MQVLFVCYANMCRSPMAEGIARKLASERALAEPITFRSAGLRTQGGLPAVPEAVSAAAEYGVDISDHETTVFMLGVADGADYVVTMTRAQKVEVIGRLPVLRLRTFTLAEFVREITGRWPSWRDVNDPVGGPAEGYGKCAAIIHGSLVSVLDTLAGRTPPRRSFLHRLMGGNR